MFLVHGEMLVQALEQPAVLTHAILPLLVIRRYQQHLLRLIPSQLLPGPAVV